MEGLKASFWINYAEKLKAMALNFNYSYIFEFLLFAFTFYYVMKIIKENKGMNIVPVFILIIVAVGFSLSLSDIVDSNFLVLVVFLLDTFILFMFNTEIKRGLLDSGSKKHAKKDVNKDALTVKDIEYTIEEIVRALQHMSKNDIGALIVLSNENLPAGIISSGTVINADINSPMIEAVFYPKAPLHDGAMIIEGNKIHAAGCFLPIIQNDNIPQEIGSRHRAALGVTAVASVTALVVSEETGIISIVRDGEIKKRYASDADLRNALSNFYWTDLTAQVNQDEKNR